MLVFDLLGIPHAWLAEKLAEFDEKGTTRRQAVVATLAAGLACASDARHWNNANVWLFIALVYTAVAMLATATARNKAGLVYVIALSGIMCWIGPRHDQFTNFDYRWTWLLAAGAGAIWLVNVALVNRKKRATSFMPMDVIFAYFASAQLWACCATSVYLAVLLHTASLGPVVVLLLVGGAGWVLLLPWQTSDHRKLLPGH